MGLRRKQSLCLAIGFVLAGMALVGGGTYVLAARATLPTTSPGHHYVTATDDLIISDPIGTHFVKRGDRYLDTPTTKTYPVSYPVAPEDVLVGVAGSPLHLVRKGETFQDDDAVYVEPVTMPRVASSPARIASEDTVVVERDGLRVVRKGEALPDRPYLKTRAAHYRVAPVDLTVTRLGERQVQIVGKGQMFLDDVTMYAEPRLGGPPPIVTPVHGTTSGT